MTKVVHRNKEPYDIDISRPNKYGNPYAIGVDGTREEVIQLYESWVQETYAIEEIVEELEGKTLGCWCKPKPCHVDVLVKLINGYRMGL